ncbi:hypothetical protein ACGFK1_20595 [Mycobacterium sp. NPDC048908]|uniref:hypothetical protein n=1 Tax=Mycobacterium sp. NPDC048908 TaxID=3364292 RepID=UPI0037109AE9
MGRHSLAKERRRPPVALAALIAPAAMFFAAGADVHPLAAEHDIKPVAPNPAPAPQPPSPCCFEIVAAAPAVPSVTPPDTNPAPAQLVSASRYRVVDRALPAGVAPEKGLQVRTILAARHISADFPEIHEIGGVRPDALRWHPNGLALDVMIPNPSSAAGIALGNQIVAYVLQNASVFGIQDAIWRGVYYTPGGAKSGGYGHYDHVHVTTTGGGYPTGDETYYR